MVEEEITNVLLTQQSSPPPPPPQHRSSKNLFDYTEEELYCSHTNSNNSTHSSSSNSNHNNKSTKSKGVLFNHYELLQIPIHATSLDIKKSYRKLSLQYHPDKTGRDENDYGTLVVVADDMCVYMWLCVVCVLSHVIFESIYSCPVSFTHSLIHTFSLSLSLIYIYICTTTTTIYDYNYYDILLLSRRQSFWPSNMRTIP